MTRKGLIFYPILLTCLSCDSANSSTAEKGIYSVKSDDPEMTTAIRQSKATLPQFLAILQRHDSTYFNFAIKVHYDDGEQVEHLWLSNPIIENGQLYGVVDNTPEFTKQVKEGQKVPIDTALATDWNYTSQNKLIGGYTIKLLRQRMTPTERDEFDKSTGWIID